MSSTDADYAARLDRLERRPWKRLLPNPYRAHIRRVCHGRTLDVGCGIGRCLAYLGPRATGIDPNPDAVRAARARGLDAHLPEELPTDLLGTFDTILCSHVLEHLARDEAVALLGRWLPAARPGGRVVAICPQERGFASDATHVTFLDRDGVADVVTAAGARVDRSYSFPLPRRFGSLWVHNETVVVGTVGGG